MKKLIMVFALILANFLQVPHLNAYDWEFKVMAVNGNIKYYNFESDSWQKLKFATQIEMNDSIIVSGKSYLSLVHNSGKTLEIINSGRYSAMDMSKSMKSSGSKHLKNIMSFIVNMMNNLNDVMNDEDFRKNMGLVSAVERNIEPKIQFPYPANLTVFSNKITLCWKPVDIHNRKFSFEMTNSDGELIFEDTTEDTLITLNIKSLKLQSGEYSCRVTLNGNKNVKSSELNLKILPEKDEEIIRNDINSIISSGTLIAPDYAALGAYLQNENLILEAEKYYKIAVDMQPEAVEYKILLNNLVKH